MPTVPSDAKRPADRKPKKRPSSERAVTANREADTITMRIRGEEFESLPLAEVFTGGWFRLNRSKDEMDAFYTMVEDAFEGVPGFLDAWDALGLPEQRDLFAEMQDAMQVSLGESSRSST